MQSVSAAFEAMAAVASQAPAFELLVEWERDAGVWHLESDYVDSFQGNTQFSLPGRDLLPPDGGGEFTFTLRNTAQRYSWKLASGGDEEIRSYISGGAGLRGKRVRVRTGFFVNGPYPDPYIAHDGAQGALAYLSSPARFQDDGQDFSAWETISGNAAYMIVVTNADGSRRWGYLGGASTVSETNDTVAVYDDFDLSTGGWNGVSGTPASYEVRYAPELVRSFTGTISDWFPNEFYEGKIDVVIRDLGAELVQVRGNTTVAEAIDTDAWIEQIVTEEGGVDGGEVAIDASILTIPLAWLEDDSVLEDAWDAAASEGGRCHFDVFGTFHFWNLTHLLLPAHQTLRWAFTEDDDFDRLEEQKTQEALATTVVLEWSTRYVGKTSVIYRLDRPRQIGPGESLTFEARFSYPATRLNGLEPLVDYLFMSTGNVHMNDSCTVALANVQAAKAEVTITNNHSSMAAVLRGLQIRGTPVLGGPNEQNRQDADSPSIAYERVRSLRANPYVQSYAHEQLLLSYMARRSQALDIAYTLVKCLAAPHLELGDRVSFTDGRTIGTRTGFLAGISYDYSAKGFYQNFTIWDDENLFDDGYTYFRFGSTALGGGVAYH